MDRRVAKPGRPASPWLPVPRRADRLRAGSIPSTPEENDDGRSTTTRREFLETIGGAGAVAAGTLATLESARGYAANDTLNVGLHRHRRPLPAPDEVAGPGSRRPDRRRLRRLRRRTSTAAKKLADPKAFATKHYRELLDRKDIDAVLIGSPDHWHVPMTVDACNAGKDVYVEKPLTHDLAEGAAVIEAQNRNRKIVQVGMQQRSMPHIQKARELIKAGRIGKVFKVHLTWNRNSRPRFQRGAAGRSTRARSTGRRSSATPPTSRSTSTASATGAGSGISAAASSPT